jgi:hypothetical protein
MRVIAIILLCISILAFAGATTNVISKAHFKSYEPGTPAFISYAVGSYLLPIVLLIGGLLLLEKAKRKKDENQQQKRTSKKFIIAFYVIAAFCLISVVSFLCIGFLFGSSYWDSVVADCKKNNARCPVMVDEYTRLDSCISTDGKSIVYNSTLINLNLTDEYKNKMLDAMREQVTNTLKKNTETNEYLRVGGIMIYKYFDENKKLLFEFEVKDTP